jgi:hypothetical protein
MPRDLRADGRGDGAVPEVKWEELLSAMPALTKSSAVGREEDDIAVQSLQSSEDKDLEEDTAVVGTASNGPGRIMPYALSLTACDLEACYRLESAAFPDYADRCSIKEVSPSLL